MGRKLPQVSQLNEAALLIEDSRRRAEFRLSEAAVRSLSIALSPPSEPLRGLIISIGTSRYLPENSLQIDEVLLSDGGEDIILRAGVGLGMLTELNRETTEAKPMGTPLFA